MAKTHKILMPMQAVIHAISVKVGDKVQGGQEIGLLEAMKMHHPLIAPVSGEITALHGGIGDVLDQGRVFAEMIETAETSPDPIPSHSSEEPAPVPQLDEMRARIALTLDAARPDAVAKRHQRGHRTARENVDDLCDPESFIEYGQLALAAQRSRKSLDELIAQTPADGMVTGFGTVNAGQFGAEAARVAVLAYDYTVLAGTQGAFNHKKTDRLLELAHDWSVPSVFHRGRRWPTRGHGYGQNPSLVAGCDELRHLCQMQRHSAPHCH